MKIRLTTLDPLRPARDMLEDLLSGIRGCWLLYQDYALTSADPDDDDTSDDELDDEIDTAFRAEVRARASADRHRLDLEAAPTPAIVVHDDADLDDAGDEREIDINLEAEDTCEQFARLVLETEQWDLPREVVASVVEIDNDDAGRLLASLIARAVGYLVSFKEAGISTDQLEDAVNWIGSHHGAEYAGPAAIAAALAGHRGSRDLIAQRIGADEVTLEQLSTFLGIDFFPAMIWLCTGMVATTGDGDIEWLRQHRITGS